MKLLANPQAKLMSAAWTAILLAALPGLLSAQPVQLDEHARVHPVSARHGMVVAQEAQAARIGRDILARGGNAVDAAVATGFAMAVTLPQAGNLGGGGFMVIHLAETGETHALDYRETAPAQAHRDMFLGADGKADPHLSRHTHLAVGVPGTVAGLAAALKKYGTLSLSEVLAPAIQLAEAGFPVNEALASDLLAERQHLLRSADSRRTFFRENGNPLQPGDILRQPELAHSLRLIAEHGVKAFYRGEIADRIIADMEAHGGLIKARDLANYRPVWRKPVRGVYRGYEIHSMPPPSSGGIHLVQILNLLEPYPLRELGPGGARYLHLLAETMKLAYADRSVHLGDPDFVNVPLSGLVSKAYADSLRPTINPEEAVPADSIRAGNPFPFRESRETTHYSVVDRDGNAVSNTYTLNFRFGIGHIAAGTGILLNNEMDDFSARPGTPNAYGLIGGEFNAIEPSKRMLSSMTPTIVLKDGRVRLVTGSPGGSRIITTTLQLVLNVIDHGMNIAEATHAPRMHHQWLPDELLLEEGFSPDTSTLLHSMGHRIKFPSPAIGSTQSIEVRNGVLHGSSDPRRPGGAAAGF